MKFRLQPFLLWAMALSLPCLTVDAAKKKDEPTYEFTIPAAEAPKYLNADDLREWRRIQRDIQLARADIETGEWLEAKEYSAFVSKARIDADRKKGKELKADAEVRLTELTEQQNQLRLKAEAAVKAHQAQFEGQEFSLTIQSLPLADASNKPTEAMLYKLWNQNYTKLLFGGAYVFQDGYYAKNRHLSERIRGTIARLDGNRYTLEEDITEFSLGYAKGQPVIDFEERDLLVGKYKAAVIMVEVIDSPEAPAGLYAVHAIDLKSGKLIDQTIVTYPNDPASRELLGGDNTAESTAAPAATDAAETKAAPTKGPVAKSEPVKPSASGELSAIRVVLHDDSNFLGRLGDARDQYIFDIAYVGQIDGYDQRAALLLNRALMRQQGLRVDDLDFITLALKPMDSEIEVKEYFNAVWRVSPTTPVDFGLGEYMIQAQAEHNGQPVSVDIGQLTVEAVDPNSIPPQAAK